MAIVPKLSPDLGGVAPTSFNPVSQGSGDAVVTGARQTMQFGQEIEQGGQRMAALELDALQQANQLRVDDGLNQLKETSLDLRFNPKSGYESLRGLDALQRSSGQSLAVEYSTMFKKRASDIENSLANDAQKRAFRMHSNNMLTQFDGEAKQHEARQFQEYALSVRDGTIRNRLNELALNYDNPEATDAAVRSIAAATYDQARILGKSAEWAEAQTRDAVSKAHAIAVQTALQKNNSTYADAYLKKYAGQMNADDILSVSGHLTKQLDGQIGVDTATQVMQQQGPRIVTSDSDRAYNIALGTESNNRQFNEDGTVVTSPKGAIGAAQIMPDTAPEAAKLAGLPWDETRYKTDADYNRALGKAYFTEQLRANQGNLAMAYAAYNAGPGRLKEAKAEAEKEGQPQNWLTYLPKETQNYVAKNMAAFGNGAGHYQRPTLAELQNEVRTRIGAKQPERLKIALDETERQYTATVNAIKQKNEEAVATAMRGVTENGGRFTDLPANVRGNIAPEDVTKVMDFAKRISSGDDTTSLLLYQKLKTNPQSLKDMTDDQFFALRSELSQSDFKHFAEERGKLISGAAPNSPGDMNSEAINRTLSDRLRSMGIDPTPKDSDTAAVQQVGAIRRFIDQSIAVEQANRGKKMTDVEVSSYIDQVFAQQGPVYHWYRPNTSAPLLTTTVGDIPSATKQALTNAFKREGIENPTDADLLNAYWRHVSYMQKQQKQQKQAQNKKSDTQWLMP